MNEMARLRGGGGEGGHGGGCPYGGSGGGGGIVYRPGDTQVLSPASYENPCVLQPTPAHSDYAGIN